MLAGVESDKEIFLSAFSKGLINCPAFYFVKINLPFLVIRKLYSSFWCTMTISLFP
jgi:hypothetical protein